VVEEVVVVEVVCRRAIIIIRFTRTLLSTCCGLGMNGTRYCSTFFPLGTRYYRTFFALGTGYYVLFFVSTDKVLYLPYYTCFGLTTRVLALARMAQGKPTAQPA
jgi:hypothetical protein